MSVAALRRSSARVTPTRTLLLSEQEHRAVTPTTTTTSSLFEPRPRSNPRTRTPRRQESPLDPDVFRRRNDGEATSRTQRARPITEVPVVSGWAVSLLLVCRIDCTRVTMDRACFLQSLGP